MMSRTRESAASRCPPEIWLETFRTFRFVKFATNCDDSMDAYAPDDDGIAREHHHISARRRKDAERTFATLSSVCRTWKALVTPFLYEWVSVDSWCGLQRAQQLNGRLNEQYTLGSFVRRLDFVNVNRNMKDASNGQNTKVGCQYHHPEPLEPSYYVSQHQMVAAHVQKAVEQCPQLERFTYHDNSHPHYVFDILPPSTVTVLAITGSWQSITYNLAVRIIAYCPLLATLDLSGCEVRCDQSNSDDGLDARTIALAGPRALRSLSLYPIHRNTAFFDFLASLDLPLLRNVCLKGSSCDTFAAVKSFLTAHGSQITSLELQRYYESIGIRAATTIAVPLATFPNLVSLVMDHSTRALMRHDDPHAVLEQIGFHSRLIKDCAEQRDLYWIQHYHRSVKALVSKICSAPFPALKSIRMLDIASTESFLTHEEHCEQWLGLHSDLVRSCADRGVQLEDCIGRPFSHSKPAKA